MGIRADRIIHDIHIHRNSHSSISHTSNSDRSDVDLSEVLNQDQGVQVNEEEEMISSHNNSVKISDS